MPSLGTWTSLWFFPIHLSLELTFSVYFLSQGLAYQLIDDVLDFTGTSASFGKGALSDMCHVTHLSLMWYVIVYIPINHGTCPLLKFTPTITWIGVHSIKICPSKDLGNVLECHLLLTLLSAIRVVVICTDVSHHLRKVGFKTYSNFWAMHIHHIWCCVP